MKRKVMLVALLILSSIFFVTNLNCVSASDVPLEAELFITEDVDLIEYGEEKTIDLKFVQRGLNWTELEEQFKPIFTKVLWPTVMFRSLRQFLGYNSVVFEAEVVGNPQGWQAWVTPGSVSKFTGDQEVDLELHVKVVRPTNVNTAVVRVKFTAYGGDNSLMGEAGSDVVVSVTPTHLMQVRPINEVNSAAPNTVTYVPLEVTNLGNYDDAFGFRVNNDDKDILVDASGQVSLAPGETGYINIMILTPDTYIYDGGTGRKINITAYSLLDTETMVPVEIDFVTRGFQLSENFIMTIIAFIIIFLVLLFSIGYIINNREPKEKKKKEKKEVKKFFKRPKKEPIEKPKKVETKKPEPVKVKTVEPVKIETPKKPAVDAKLEKERLKKQKAIERIKRQQK